MTSHMVWIAPVFLIGLYVVYMVINITRRNKKNRWQERLEGISIERSSVGSPPSPAGFLREDAKPKSARASRLSSKIVRVTSIKHWLRNTGYNISPLKLYLVGTVFAAIIMAILQLILTYHFLILGLLSFILSTLVCYTGVNVLIGRQKAKFLSAFPDALDLVRRALRAGYSADRSIVMAASESPEPVKCALQSVIDRQNIGEPLDVALTDVANDVGIDEFHLLSIVLVLQRDTGGSLADVVENFSKIMRERLRLRKKVKAITAEGKASGYLVSIIPFAISCILMVVAPGYLQPLFETERGHTFLMVGGGLMTMGFIIIYRMVNKEFY